MSLEEAAEYAVAEEADQPEATIARAPSSERVPTAEPTGNLTSREREAANHVAKILKKLGLRSRAQIASWVSET